MIAGSDKLESKFGRKARLYNAERALGPYSRAGLVIRCILVECGDAQRSLDKSCCITELVLK